MQAARLSGRFVALVLMAWPVMQGCAKSGGAHAPSDGGAIDVAADRPGTPDLSGSGGSAAPAGSGGTTVGTGGAAVTNGGSGGQSGTGGVSVTSGGSGGQVSTGGRTGAPGGGGGASGAAGRAGAGGANAAGGQPGVPPAGGAGGSLTACGVCATYGKSAQTGTVGVAALDSLSGLAVSRSQPDIIFAHNDHDRPVVYALDLQGRLHAQITLTNAPASDIEDIAVGPCGTQTCVFLGDIGDNNVQRTEYAILRFPSPTVPGTPGNVSMTATYDRFRFVYEDGSHNAEGLMVSPDGTLYVVTKLAPGSGGRVAATGPSTIYRLPASMTTDSVATAVKVVTLPVPAGSDLAASAAAAHPCGLGFLLRTYDKVYEFRIPAGMNFEAAFTVTPKVVAMPDEPQSEGIDYHADGRGFVTSGEGASAPIMDTACAQP